VVINTGAADGDEWSGVAQAGDGKPNGESCAVSGDFSVGEDAKSGDAAGSGDAVGSGIGVAPGLSEAGGVCGGGSDGVAGAGFGFIGAASRQ
jgi:hypothetical protein